jgi:hypothetical protein
MLLRSLPPRRANDQTIASLLSIDQRRGEIDVGFGFSMAQEIFSLSIWRGTTSQPQRDLAVSRGLSSASGSHRISRRNFPAWTPCGDKSQPQQ